MRIIRFLLAGLAACLISCTSARRVPTLEEGFADPPTEARPQVWWHWMDGNVTKDGILKDLEWMHRSGIGGVHCFEAGVSMAPVVENRLVYMTPEWKDAFRYAMRVADSLGLETTIASCPGWSNTGGPWVKPEDAMKKLVWSSIRTKGGCVRAKLPEPEKDERWYRDTYVIAVRIPEDDFSAAELGGVRSEDKDGMWVQINFPSEVTVRALSISDGQCRTVWAAKAAPIAKYLEVSDDGLKFRRVCGIPHGSVTWQTIETGPVTGRYFRVVYDKKPERKPELELYTTPRINHAEEKAGFATPSDLMTFPTSDYAGILKSDVIDITDRMDEDGNLAWNAPEGRWKIFRFGVTLTGKQNHPAPPEATGLEVSKLDGEAFTAFLTHYLEMYQDATGGKMAGRGLLIDSYEAGHETWTPCIAREFESRRGYSLIPWLPVLTGEIVGSAAESEEFLYDWRTTIGELIEENMYANAARIAEKYGMTTWFESHENGRLYLVDGMAAKSKADIPMAATWVVNPDVHADHSGEVMGESDIRESASVAHLYGKPFVATESLTVDGIIGGAYSFYPGNLKPTADLEMAGGMNRFVVHESAHQPVDDKKPGLGLGIYGQWFNRHETWAEQARAWTDYIARSCFMLQQGRNVADILYYYGEDDVVTSLFAHEHPALPFGYNFDYLNKEALLELIGYDGKNFTVPSGNKWSVLLIDSRCQHFSPAVREKLDDLKAQGAPLFDLKDCAAAEALSSIAPDFEPTDNQNLRYVHRSCPEGEIYWVNNRQDAPRRVQGQFRVNGLKPALWHPETGAIEPVSYRIDGDRTVVWWDMTGWESVFIVFRGEAEVSELILPEKTETLLCDVDGPWRVSFDPAWGGPEETTFETLISYTESSDTRIRYYSGTAVYSTVITLPEPLPEGDFVLNLGSVGCMAEVSVNGVPAGTLWRSPYKVDVDRLLRPGNNKLEIKVVNPWVNRIIGDLQPDCRHNYTYTHFNFYRPDSPLIPSGLLGPVEILTINEMQK